MKSLYAALAFGVLIGCKTGDQKNSGSEIGSFETTDPSFSSIVSSNASFEILGEGYEWSEGPVWVPQQKMLLFSDVPKNVIHKWTEGKPVEVYLTPSGYSGTGQYSNEPGSNGLTLSPDGKLVLCQHGDRRVAMMDADLAAPQPKFITLANRHDGKKLSSPNDVTFRSNGDMFFTDPPYGLPKQEKDSTKETPYNGVYKTSAGKTILLVDSLTRPNGIDLFPGEKSLIVANSDPDKARWYKFELNDKDSIISARIFYDATSNSKAGEKGLPDGLRVDKLGNVYATGPGGIWIFNSEGKVLGRIRLKENAANCELSEDEKTLFVTNDMYLIRIKLRE